MNTHRLLLVWNEVVVMLEGIILARAHPRAAGKCSSGLPGVIGMRAVSTADDAEM